MATEPIYTTAIAHEHGVSWELLQLVEESGHGAGIDGYFYHLREAGALDMFAPVAVREMMGGPVRFMGKRFSQHAPGSNVYD